jgi:uncharacterized Zn finger protein
MKPKRLKFLKEKGKRLSVRVIRPEHENMPYTAIVGSNSNAVFNHVVTVKFEPDGTIKARCTCPWAEHGGIACSHVMATLTTLAESKQRVLSFWPTHEDAARQKRTVFNLVSNLSSERIWITSRPAS